jgi:RNA polymerase sigma factor (sigma-70 family)
MASLLRHRLSESTFEDLYRAHAGDVYRYALAVTGNRADAEDVAQTTFMNAYRALERGERPLKPHNWLIAIAHNVCRQRFRRASRQPTEVVFEEDAAEALVPSDDAPTAADIQRALGHLAPNQREALVMRELGGSSYPEIAEVLGLSVSAVETLIFRARRALREQLDGSLTCSQAEAALSLQLDGRLPRGEAGQLRAHLRECDECRLLARRQRAQRKAFKAFAAVPLPPSLLSALAGSGTTSTTGGVSGGAAATATGGGVAGGGTAGVTVATSGLLGGGLAAKAAAVAVAAVVAGGGGYAVVRHSTAPPIRPTARAASAGRRASHLNARGSRQRAAARAPSPARSAPTVAQAGGPAASRQAGPARAVRPVSPVQEASSVQEASPVQGVSPAQEASPVREATPERSASATHAAAPAGPAGSGRTADSASSASQVPLSSRGPAPSPAPPASPPSPASSAGPDGPASPEGSASPASPAASLGSEHAVSTPTRSQPPPRPAGEPVKPVESSPETTATPEPATASAWKKAAQRRRRAGRGAEPCARAGAFGASTSSCPERPSHAGVSGTPPGPVYDGPARKPRWDRSPHAESPAPALGRAGRRHGGIRFPSRPGDRG